MSGTLRAGLGAYSSQFSATRRWQRLHPTPEQPADSTPNQRRSSFPQAGQGRTSVWACFGKYLTSTACMPLGAFSAFIPAS